MAMKALVKSEAGPGLWLKDVPQPEIGINDLLIRVLRTGICGTDLHIYDWDAWAQRTIPVPLVIGHEFVGEVVEVGSNVNDFHPGDLVSGEGHLVCGRCRNCMAGRRHLCAHTQGVGVNRDGAFAEYISLPMTNVWKHPPDIALDIAAIFDPFGNAVHTALSFPVLGEDVLITGAGPIGLMAIPVVRFAGARHVVITDVNEYRLDLARQMGATRALDVRSATLPDTQRELGMQEGFDVGLEMSGVSSAMRDMLANMAHGGRIALLGLPSAEYAIDWTTVIFNMLTIKGIYGREMYETWYKMAVLVQSGLDISPVITHRFDYQDYEEAFATARSGHAGKVIMRWAEPTHGR
jgi:threonine 3-dehydrogenase